jgi:hypothetical protein
MRDSNVIMIGELAKNIGDSIVAKTNYGTAMQIQRRTTGSLVQYSRYSRILTMFNIIWTRNASSNAAFGVVEDGYRQ